MIKITVVKLVVIYSDDIDTEKKEVIKSEFDLIGLNQKILNKDLLDTDVVTIM